jgi:hypothetical protein
MGELRTSLTDFAGPDDPLTLSVCAAENWPGRAAMHRVHYAGLRTITELDELDESRLVPTSWRFFAGGHQTKTAAAGCMATCGRPGSPLKVLAVTRGPAPAAILTCTESLNDLSELSGNPNNHYDMRVLRIPALGIEAFWLKSQSAGVGDLVVPYGWMPRSWDFIQRGPDGTASKNQAVPAADFLRTLADAARQRLAKPDIAPLAHRTGTLRRPVKPTERPSSHVPRPGDSFSLTGVYWAGAPLEGIGPAKALKPRSEPDRVAEMAQAGH